MKIQLLKKICFVGLALICGCLTLWNSARAEPPTMKPDVSPQPTILSLPYHGEASAPPRSVSLFWGEADLFIGKMLCSDKERNIYIYDQVSHEQCAIKKFDAQGQLMQTWSVKLHGLGDGVSATVLPDGKVWLNLGVGAFAGEKSGLPLVILQPGSSKPVADWQQSLPEFVNTSIYGSVGSDVWQSMLPQIKSQTRTWMITRLDNTGDRVFLDIMNFGGAPTYYPPEAKITKAHKLSWRLVLSSDGGQLIQANPITEVEARTSTLFRSSDGVLWHSETDWVGNARNWTMLWVWKDGEAKGVPLVTRAELSQPREEWQKLIGTQPQNPPQITVDGKDNLYLNWQRKAIKPDRTFTVGKESWSRGPMDEDGGQRALIVFNSQRKFVASVPWTLCYYQSEDWIFPIPDGSGFYRSEFGEKEMDIYWHPLPNFNAPASAPDQTANSDSQAKP